MYNIFSLKNGFDKSGEHYFLGVDKLNKIPILYLII
jgi:hypothetical protein